MRCFAYGHEMEVTQSEPHESLPNFAYDSFRCSGCADTERRLLPRGRVPVIGPTTAARPSMPKPEEMIGRTEDHDMARDIAMLWSRSPRRRVGIVGTNASESTGCSGRKP
jgi:hypothetical protein